MQLVDDKMMSVFEVILVLLLSVIIVAVIPKIREIQKNTVKTSIYIFMGLILFMMVGMGYDVIQGMYTPAVGMSMSAQEVLGTLYPYTQFFPLLILSIAVAGIVLVTYVDGEKYGLIMAGAAFAAMLPDTLNYASSGRFDLFLLGCIIWSLIPVIWVLLFRRIIYEDSTMRERIWAAISASLISYLLYVCTALIALFGESSRDYSGDVMSTVAARSSDILGFVVISLWFYILLTVITVSLMFIIHDLALHFYNLQRVVNSGRKEIDYLSTHPVETIVNEIQPKVDAYKGLIEEMQVFNKYFDRVDRLRAASTIARFKQEYITLAARHTDGSKLEAEQLIKVIDQQFKQKY